MNALKNLVIASILIMVIGWGIFEKRRASWSEAEARDSGAEKDRLESELNQLKGQVRMLRQERARTGASQAFESTGKAPPSMVVATELGNRTNMISQIINATNWPSLTAKQAESYLAENKRSAASLLAVFRANGDKALLEEALREHPNDPQVNFAAVFKSGDSPEERRKQLDSFVKSAPDNALASYLSALDYLKAGQPAKAIQELAAAAGKTQFQDYAMTFSQNSEEAYRSAGYTEAEAKMITQHSLLHPDLVALKQFGQSMVTLAENYRQTGDEASAQRALELGIDVGQRIERNTSDASRITQLSGMAIEEHVLRSMNPAARLPNGSGQTVADRISEIRREKTEAQDLGRQFGETMPSVTPQDWISYSDRSRSFGEGAAIRWLVDKYHQK